MSEPLRILLLLVAETLVVGFFLYTTVFVLLIKVGLLPELTEDEWLGRSAVLRRILAPRRKAGVFRTAMVLIQRQSYAAITVAIVSTLLPSATARGESDLVQSRQLVSSNASGDYDVFAVGENRIFSQLSEGLASGVASEAESTLPRAVVS